MADQSISEEQKQALVRIYLSFRRDHEDKRADPAPEEPATASTASTASTTSTTARSDADAEPVTSP
jgi:hypothetical protein